MPKIQDIDQLKDIIDTLGDEKEIRAKRGEEIEEIAPPQEGLAADLEDLLGITPGKEQAPAEREETLSLDEFNLDDIAREATESGGETPSFEEFMTGEEAGLGPKEEVILKEGVDVTGTQEESDEGALDFPDVADMTDLGGGKEESIEPPPQETVFQQEEPSLEMPPAGMGVEPEATFDLADFGITGEQAGEPEQPFEPPIDLSSLGQVPETPAISEPPAETEGTGEEFARFELPDFDFGTGGEEGKTEQAPPEIEQPPPGAEPVPTVGLEEQLFDLTSKEPESPAMGPEPEISVEPTEEGFGSFEMPDLSEIEGGFGEVPPAEETPEQFELQAEEGDHELDQLPPDQFALPEFGKGFQPPEEEPPKKEKGPSYPTEKIARKEALVLGELAGVDEEYEFSNRDFESIKATLAILPLNLKIIVEELIGEKDLRGEKLKRLLDALVAGESPKVIASIVASITGQKIILPKSYEKKTGIAFEKEKESFAYFLKTRGLKAAIIFGVALIVLGVLVVAGYLYIYRPLSALPLYDEGYAEIYRDKYESANQKFKQASAIWDSKDQYYRYAEGFVDRGNYYYAHLKYTDLLSRYPGDVKGTVDYARLETLRQKFEHAEDLLVDDLLMRDMYNFNGIVATAENYLRWAETDFGKSKDAQYYYDFLVERYRDRMSAHLKRLDYFIRIEKIAREKGINDFDNTNMVLAYAGYLKRNNYNTIDPLVYSDLAEYLINKNETAQVEEILFKALASTPRYPETYYELARFYRLSAEPKNELAALESAITLFENPSDQKSQERTFQLAHERKYSLDRTAKLILAYNRLGEFYTEQGTREKAEDKLLSAQKLYEQDPENLKKTAYAKNGSFGKIYYNLGNLAFAVSNYDKALDLYTAAERNGFKYVDQTYKKGFVYYAKANFDKALIEFHAANAELPDNENILYALATTEYKRYQYPISEGYYLHLIRLLGKKKDTIPQIRVEDNPVHRDLITNLYIAYNNIGCTYFKKSTFPSDTNETEALVYLSKASELYDVVSRDQETMKRLEESKIAVLKGKKETVLGKDYLKAPTPFYNLDIINHGKAGQTVLGEKLDVIVYDLIPVTLASNKLLLKDSDTAIRAR